MQERVLLGGWIERRSTEHYREADAPIRGALTRPNRSRTARSRQSSPTK